MYIGIFVVDKEAAMKRFIALFAVLICMTMILPLTAFAGDIPESLLFSDVCDLINRTDLNESKN